MPAYGGRNAPCGGASASTVSTAQVWSCGISVGSVLLMTLIRLWPGVSNRGLAGERFSATFNASW